jgi:hypothetical protein
VAAVTCLQMQHDPVDERCHLLLLPQKT